MANPNIEIRHRDFMHEGGTKGYSLTAINLLDQVGAGISNGSLLIKRWGKATYRGSKPGFSMSKLFGLTKLKQKKVLGFDGYDRITSLFNREVQNREKRGYNVVNMEEGVLKDVEILDKHFVLDNENISLADISSEIIREELKKKLGLATDTAVDKTLHGYSSENVIIDEMTDIEDTDIKEIQRRAKAERAEKVEKYSQDPMWGAF